MDGTGWDRMGRTWPHTLLTKVLQGLAVHLALTDLVIHTALLCILHQARNGSGSGNGSGRGGAGGMAWHQTLETSMSTLNGGRVGDNDTEELEK